MWLHPYVWLSELKRLQRLELSVWIGWTCHARSSQCPLRKCRCLGNLQKKPHKALHRKQQVFTGKPQTEFWHHSTKFDNWVLSYNSNCGLLQTPCKRLTKSPFTSQCFNMLFVCMLWNCFKFNIFLHALPKSMTSLWHLRFDFNDFSRPGLLISWS